MIEEKYKRLCAVIQFGGINTIEYTGTLLPDRAKRWRSNKAHMSSFFIINWTNILFFLEHLKHENIYIYIIYH